MLSRHIGGPHYSPLVYPTLLMRRIATCIPSDGGCASDHMVQTSSTALRDRVCRDTERPRRCHSGDWLRSLLPFPSCGGSLPDRGFKLSSRHLREEDTANTP